MIPTEQLNCFLTRRRKLAHVPFAGGTGGPRVGLSPLPEEEPWLSRDEDCDVQLELKRRYVDECFAELPGSQTAQREALVAVWNCLYEHKLCLRDLRDHYQRLRVAGMYCQDDLCIVERRNGRWVFTAGSVCFPTGWSVHKMVGRPTTEVHGKVATDQFRVAVDKALDRVGEKPQQRLNWFLYDSPALRHDWEKRMPDDVTPENAGSRLFIRYERQTLRQLPESGALLFTIRVYVDPVRTLREEQPELIPDFLLGVERHASAGPWRAPLEEYLRRASY